MTFVHLEVHSHFTLLSATASVQDLVARAVADSLYGLALTDADLLCGAVAFDRACRSAGIQPIIGMTVRSAAPGGGGVTAPALDGGSGHLVLLAKDPAGYRSLCRLSSVIQAGAELNRVPPQGRAPVLDWQHLLDHHEGLICLSGGRRGWIEHFVRRGDRAAAQLCAGRLAQIFDEDAYLALELHEPADQAVAEEVSALGQRLGLGTVAVQPVYCLAERDAARLELLAAVRDNVSLDEARARSVGRSPVHWLAPHEVAARFERFPAAVRQAGEIAARCAPCLPLGKPIWPSLALPAGQTPDGMLRDLAETGLQQRYASGASPQASARLDAELAVIASHGYAPLFLVVADLVRFARERRIPVSTRGSVANSLAAYCTGITTVDPLEHGLLFERFLNPARSNPPDIDLDFCSRRRDEVLNYVRETYGADRMALIGTVSTLRPPSAVRETGKAYRMLDEQVNRLVGLLPRSWHPDPRRRDRRTVEDVLATLDDPLERTVVQAAYELVGQPDHLGSHPGGVVITPSALPDFVPVQWAPRGFLITQFEHADIEALGLPKIDMLGIRALTVLADAAALVRRHRDPGFRLESIPLADERTAGMLERGDTIGVFQCESEGAQRTLRQLRAHTVRDLAVANAFFKPGPATGGMAAAFVRRYRDEEPVSFLHPALEPILSATKGVLLFQEQILRIARDVAGLSWEQADGLRRGMSHFGAAEMSAIREAFVDGCRQPPPAGPGFSVQQADALWEQVMAFAGYGFNQGHATAYADVSFRSAYLKAHFPAEFLVARLADAGGFHHPAVYVAEARRLGIAVCPPHVNHSLEDFTLEAPAASDTASTATLWMGLGQIRNLRRSAVAGILDARAAGQFAGPRDLAGRAELQAKELDHLIRAGALDGLGESRAAMLAEIRSKHGLRQAGQLAFDFASTTPASETPAERMEWELELLGMPVSVHPASLMAGRLLQCTPLRDLEATMGKIVAVAGVRLPGWTGGQGFFLDDGETFITVRGDRSLRIPKAWLPVLVRGRWLKNELGMHWLQAAEISPMV